MRDWPPCSGAGLKPPAPFRPWMVDRQDKKCPSRSITLLTRAVSQGLRVSRRFFLLRRNFGWTTFRHALSPNQRILQRSGTSSTLACHDSKILRANIRAHPPGTLTGGCRNGSGGGQKGTCRMEEIAFHRALTAVWSCRHDHKYIDETALVTANGRPGAAGTVMYHVLESLRLSPSCSFPSSLHQRSACGSAGIQEQPEAAALPPQAWAP